jgi:hypothetical protein
MLALTPLVLQLIQLGITVVPELIAAAQQEIALFNSGTEPNAAQQADIDTALATAHAALQAAQQGTVAV